MEEEAAPQQQPLPPASSQEVRLHVSSLSQAKSSPAAAVSSFHGSRRPPRYRLRRVPQRLRDINREAYQPKFMGIGLYGYGYETTDVPAENLKVSYLEGLLNDVESDPSKHDDILERCRRCLEAEEIVDNFRWFYPELGWSTDYVRIMLYDGCFIIKHLYNFANGYNEEELYATRWAPAQLRIDLAMLENQFPFFLLEEMFHHLTPRRLMPKITAAANAAGGGDYQLRLQKRRALLDMALWYMLQGWYPMTSSQSPMEYLGISAEEEVHHLLHLVHIAHRVRVDAAVAERRSLQLAGGWRRLCCRPLKSFVSGWSLRFLRLLLCMCWCRIRSDDDDERPSPNPSEKTASAAQLRGLGVKIKTVPQGRGGILDVRLRDDHVTLEMPPLFVDHATAPLLQNLVAYEQQGTAPPSTGGEEPEDYFTTYAFLMYNLVSTTEDVTLLQEDGVVFNNLGSHQAVVDYFQNLCQWPIQRSDTANPIADALQQLRKCSRYRPYRDSAIKLFLLVVSAVVTVCTIVQTTIGIIYRKS